MTTAMDKEAIAEVRLNAAARALYKAYEETTDEHVENMFSWAEAHDEPIVRDQCADVVSEMRGWAEKVLAAGDTAILDLQSSERGEDLREAVKAKRRALGWSLRDLEAETGIGFSTLARFERGERIGNRVRAHLTEWSTLSPAEPSPESREAVIEECAKVAEEYPSLEYADIAVVRGIASAIRALKGDCHGVR